MTASSTAPTLYQDWQARKDRLTGLSRKPGDFREAELRLLTFLLRYYRGVAEAEKLARFPAQSQVFIDRRAIIVHAHLGQGYLPEIRSPDQAAQHVRKLVERMSSRVSSYDAGATGPLFDPTLPPPFSASLEAIRGSLCDSSADVRLVAIVDLGEFGTLDDVSLISDLLALPQQADEDPFERHVLITAMKKIVARHAGKPQPLPIE